MLTQQVRLCVQGEETGASIQRPANAQNVVGIKTTCALHVYLLLRTPPKSICGPCPAAIIEHVNALKSLHCVLHYRNRNSLV